MTNDPGSSAPFTVIPLAGGGPFSLSIDTKEGGERSGGSVTASGADSNVGQRNHPNQRPLPTACPGEGKPTETQGLLKCVRGLTTMLSWEMRSVPLSDSFSHQNRACFHFIFILKDIPKKSTLESCRDRLRKKSQHS